MSAELERVLRSAVGTLPDPAVLASRLDAVVAELPAAERDAVLVDAVRAVRPSTASWLRDHGATVEQAAASTADVDRKLDRYGLRGTGLDWFCSVLTARVVAIGRLQFEVGARLDDDTAVWSVHIPEGGPLDPAACDAAFAAAPRLLAAIAPAHRAALWYCRSWLLDPGVPRALGPGSNTARFAARFRLAPPGPDDSAEGDAAVAKFVFGTGLDAARAAVPTSRLQHAVRDRWSDGGHWSARTGTAPVVDGAARIPSAPGVASRA